jgi:hypothetical protein
MRNEEGSSENCVYSLEKNAGFYFGSLEERIMAKMKIEDGGWTLDSLIWGGLSNNQLLGLCLDICMFVM